MKYSQSWTFESLTDIELNGLHQAVGEPSWQDRLKGRWTFLDADAADPESLDDGPRPSDVQADCPQCGFGVRRFGHYRCDHCEGVKR